MKFTENTWKIKFNEHEDRDLFVQVLNRGVSFHGNRLKARNWVFSFTPQELWEEVERLADAANQNFHEGLGGNRNTQQNTQNGAQKGNKKVNDTRNVQDHCSICLLLGSTNRAKTHSTANHRWSAYDHKVIGENVSNPQNSDRNDRQVHGAKGGKGNSTPSGGNKNTGGPGGSQGKGNRTPSGFGGQPNGQTSPNVNAGGGNRNPGQTLNPVKTKEMLQDHRVKVREILREPPSLVRAEGVATVVAHHPVAVAVDVEREIIVWIRSQVQTRCLMRIEITSKML